MVKKLPFPRNYLAAILSLLFFAAQSQTITGTVTAEDGESLIGVTIQVKSTTRGTTTNIDGKYSVLANSSDTLVFSYVGFTRQQVVVGNRTTIDVTMVLNLTEMEEVVVIGYGGVRKSDLTGSVSTIEKEKLQVIPAANPVDALQGQVAGVQISNNSGAPGSSPTVLIRGVGTSGNPSPLYVVDGVLLNDISFLNSADIASLTVLKDASALAIYGNRGANGVILIETQKGSSGSRINISSSYGVQVQQNRIDLLNAVEYAQVINEINPGTFNNLDALTNTDWQELIFEPATVQTHTVSVSGSNETNQYYFSVGYFGQKGVIPESNYNRITIKVNEKYSPKKYLSLGTNITYSPFWQDNTRNDAPFNVYRADPTVLPRNADGSFNEVPGVGNILADLEFTTDNRTVGNRLVGQVFVEGYFLDGFTAKTSVGIESLEDVNESFVPVFFVSAAQQNPETAFTRNQFERTSLIWENTLNYDKQIDQHRINAVIGFTVQEVTNEQFNLTARNLVRSGDDFRYIDQNNIDPNSIANGVRDPNDFFTQESYLGRLNYSYDERYLFTFTFRRDGSSKFLGDNRYGNFPAVALGWNMINEDFLTLPQVFTNLKLRGSWGIVGNDKINYLASYNTTENFNAVFGTDEQLNAGVSDNLLGNPDLRWEEVEQYNIGLELGLFEQRLTAEFDYFSRETNGTLIGLQLPDFLGNGTNLVTFNAGVFRNSGFEFNINWEDEIGELSYSVGARGNTLKNETLRVSALEGFDQIFGQAQGQTVTRTQVGSPIGAFFGYVVDGVFQNQEQVDNTPSLFGTQPGDLIFRDINEDNVINADDRTQIGSPIPDLIYGINLGLGYKNFTLDLLFQGQHGNEIFNIKETVRPAQYNYEQRYFDFWRGEGTSNSEPRPTAGGNNFLPSSRFIQNGSFFRLRAVTIGYMLSEEILDKVGVSSCRFYLRGNNVFTITDFTGYSPEIGGGPLTSGVDTGTYPVVSTYTAGIDLAF